MNIRYRKDLFTKDTINQHLAYYLNLIKEVTANPQKQVGQISLLMPSEQEELVTDFNNTETDFPLHKCLHELFKEQAKQHPDNIALVYDGASITYKELDKRSTDLAIYLQNKGVQSETLVGLFMEYSIESIVSILGILKAGGAYVPIDPNYPEQRMDYIIQDGIVGGNKAEAVKLILVQKHLNEKIEKIVTNQDIELIAIASDWESNTFLQSTSGVLAKQVSSENLAYIIYTSGSTGKPKGVLIEHRTVVNLALAQIDNFGMDHQERVLLLSKLTFDASVEQLFISLLSGACLYMPKEKDLLSPEILSQHIEAFQITHIHSAPELIKSIEVKSYPALKRVLTGGDSCPKVLAEAWSQYCDFINEYGPTETTVTNTELKYTAAYSQYSILPIGKPIQNTSIYILDKDKRLKPKGIPGEIYIGGSGLARGYLNRPELSKEKFIDNPFGKGRIYGSGDLGRWLPDGNIEILGRIDQQVKIRGFRIELGEIEETLNLNEQIQNSAVIAKDHAGSKTLVAYYVPINEEQEIESLELRNWLAQSLPEYMLPSFIIPIESIPLNVNGKIDRKKLTALDIEVVSSKEYTEARTETEQVLVNIWQEVLEIEKVGIFDNFFELGGDSIKSIQVISLAGQYGISFSAQDVLSSETIADLAPKASIRTIHKEPDFIEGNANLLPIQHELFQKTNLNFNHFNQAVLLQIPKEFTKDTIIAAFDKLSAHHDTLRLRYQEKESGWVQYYSPLEENEVHLNSYDFESILQDNIVETIEKTNNEIQASLNIQEGPLFRLGFMKLGDYEENNRLFICVHHLLIDGVSWRILLAQLEQILRNEQFVLPPKTTSYQYWGTSLTRFAQDKDLLNQTAYWSAVKDTYSTAKRLLNIDIPEQQTTTLKLENDLSKDLLSICNKAYKTETNDLLLAALHLAYREWTGESVMGLLLEGHGREDLFDDIDISRTIGWFTSIYPIVVDSEDTLPDTIKYVKEYLRKVPNKGIGYGILKHLAVDSSVANQPIPLEIMFNYLGDLSSFSSEKQLLKMAEESIGHSIPTAYNSPQISIDGSLTKTGLSFTFKKDYTLNSNLKLEDFAQLFKQHLIKIYEHCSNLNNNGFTPSDFPTLSVNQQELDQWITKLSNK